MAEIIAKRVHKVKKDQAQVSLHFGSPSQKIFSSETIRSNLNKHAKIIIVVLIKS